MGLFGKKKKKKEEMLLHENAVSKKTGMGRYQGMQWAVQGGLICFVCAVFFSCFYSFFRTNAEKNMSSPIEDVNNISWLYQSCYLLYRDLYNSRSEETLNYTDLYLNLDEEYQWLLDEERLNRYMNELMMMEENGETEAGEEQKSLTYEECRSLLRELESVTGYFQQLENFFTVLNSSYDYIIRDHNTGKYLTNMSASDIERGSEAQYFLLSFVFDSTGNVTIGDAICGMNENRVRKFANEAVREDTAQSLASVINKYGRMMTPVDCTVIFAVSKDTWEKMGGGYDSDTWGGYPITNGYEFSYYRSYSYGVVVNAYRNCGVSGILFLCLLGMFLLGLLLPLPEKAKPWRDKKVCAIPLEALLTGVFFLYGLEDTIVTMVSYVAGGRAYKAVRDYLPLFGGEAEFLVTIFNLLVLTMFFFCGWYIGVCARAIRGMGLKEYIKQRSLIYRFFPFVKHKAIGVYEALVHLDLTQDAHRAILKLLLVNALILFFIGSLWIGGFAITLVYSVVLYVILRKYVSDLQEKYKVLLKAVDEIANGNLNVTINEDLGVFEPFREQVFQIQDGLKKAVTMEVRSQRIKTELVTNMSHDLKTPLTAIITYVNLLKKEDLTENQRREYLEILERKSLRLKSLIEDLFEFSRANSQNITLNIMDVDIMNLVKQVEFEMSDKMNESGLDVRMNLTEEKVILPLDSQKTFRIYENLFGNIAKYALQGTRVYVNGFRIDDTVVITLKNISAQEITVEAEELTERFVRGNTSRNTEGSGLGLAIAKSFMELQGGTLELEVDGDLFKVITTWNIKGKGKLSEDTCNEVSNLYKK